MHRFKKHEIPIVAQNLIDILENDSDILELTVKFVNNWILSGNESKNKSYYDIWEIVLKNYLPKTRPVLFRATQRIYKYNRVSSFTSSIRSANRFSGGSGYLIICDTKDSLLFDERINEKGNYENSFFPLYELIIKDKEEGCFGFSKSVLNYYYSEDEYIMKTDFDNMHLYKYHNK